MPVKVGEILTHTNGRRRFRAREGVIECKASYRGRMSWGTSSRRRNEPGVVDHCGGQLFKNEGWSRDKRTLEYCNFHGKNTSSHLVVLSL